MLRPSLQPPEVIRLLLVALMLVGVSGLLGRSFPARADDAVDRHVKAIERHQKQPFEQRERADAIRAIGDIGGEQAAAALISIYEDPFIHLHDHATSAWIKMLKGDAAAETQTWLGSRALKHRDTAVRVGAWTALGLTGGPELADLFRHHAKSEKDDTVLAAMAQAACRMPEGTLSGLFAPRFKQKDGRSVFEIALAVAHHDGAGAPDALRSLQRHRDPVARAGGVIGLARVGALTEADVAKVLADGDAPPRIALALSLAEVTDSHPWPGVGEAAWRHLLDADDWRVRAAAIQGGLRRWDKSIVEPLIQRLETEPGRLRDDARRALETFTGKDIAPDPDLWRAWWSRQHLHFVPTERPRPDGHGRIHFRPGAAVDGDAGEGATAAFFDLPLYSKRIVFIFDLSGSFREAVSDEPGAPTKLELLQREMKRTLAGLPKDCEFDLMVYRYPSKYPPKPVLTRAFGRMRPADRKWLKKAGQWLHNQDAHGWGAFVEPIEACYPEDTDTAILLSDGRPSRGRYDRDWRILQELPRTNRFPYVAVHTVLVGEKDADRKFMRELAGSTGGRFREAKAR